MTDPYVYDGTHTLINKFHLKDSDALKEVEGYIYGVKISEPLPLGKFDYTHLKAIHRHFFEEIYEWAGKERTVSIAKGNSLFAHPGRITPALNKLFDELKADHYLTQLSKQDLCPKLSYYFNELNAAHPFREGNGRTQRAFCELLAENVGYKLNWKLASEEEYLKASVCGFIEADYLPMTLVFEKIISPIRKQEITLEEIPQLTEDSMKKLGTYIHKQVELTQLIQKKHVSLSKEPSLSKILNEQALLLGNEVRLLAKELTDLDEIQLVLKSHSKKPYLVSLSKQGGFIEIHQRFQKKQLQTQDILAVLRFAKSQGARLTQASLSHTHTVKV